jgi:hypothetical protein
MTKRKWIAALAAVVLLGALGLYAIRHWSVDENQVRAEILALMPDDASAVFFADLAQLRNSPFFLQLYKWAPRPQADADYAEFLRNTGFDYERDLNRLALAVEKRGQESALFAIADGHFDRQKIAAYATKTGTLQKRGARDIFSVPLSGSTRRISFTFLRSDRLAITDDADLAAFLAVKQNSTDTAEWRERFQRLAGSPVFAVVRQSAGTGAALAAQAPGGLRSPQLSALLDQLQWLTLAARPENDGLRVVAEGECTQEGTVRQLTDLLNGVTFLAQAGLNDPKTRQQLNPAAREAYLELLKSADVSKIDRGETKSVRIVFDVTPRFLEAARLPPQTTPAAPPASKPKTPPASKSRTPN